MVGKPTESSSQGNSRFVFDLRLIFYVVTLIAAGLAFSPISFVFSLCVLLFWWMCFAAVRAKFNASHMAFIAIAVVLGICCSGMLLPSVSRVREAARSTACLNNMRQFGLALLNYESTYQRFPEAIKTVAGNPHSWRIEILPFIEQDTLYRNYDYQQAWDSSFNMKLAKTSFNGMECPFLNEEFKTSYKLVTGKGTLFEQGTLPTIERVSDGTANTIVLIEDAAHPVFWSDPNGNIDIEDAVKLLSEMDSKNSLHYYSSIFTTKYPGIHVALLDGSVRRVGYHADPKEIRRAFLCADGQSIDISDLGHAITVVKWGAVVSFVIYGILIIWPIVPLVRESRRMKRNSNQFELEKSKADDAVTTRL